MAAHNAWRMVVTALELPAQSANIATFGHWNHATTGTDLAENSQGFTFASSGSGVANLFDGSQTSIFQVINANLPTLFGKRYPSARDIKAYTLSTHSFALNTMPSAWTLEYSDDADAQGVGTWTVAHTVSGETGWTLGETRRFVIPDLPIISIAHRIVITEGGGSGTGMSELDFLINGVNVTGPLAGSFHTGIQSVPVFDDDTNTTWLNTNALGTGFVIGKFINLTADLTEYTINTASNPNVNLKSWTLEKSNDTTDGFDGTWQIIDTNNGITDWVGNTTRSFIIFDTIAGDLAATETGGPDTFFAISPIFIGAIEPIKSIVNCTFFADNTATTIVPIATLIITDRLKGISSAQLTIPNAGEYARKLRDWVDNNGSFGLSFEQTLLTGEIIYDQSKFYTISSIAFIEKENNFTASILGNRKFLVGTNTNKLILKNEHKIDNDFNGSLVVDMEYDSRLKPGDIISNDAKDYTIFQTELRMVSDNTFLKLVLTGG